MMHVPLSAIIEQYEFANGAEARPHQLRYLDQCQQWLMSGRGLPQYILCEGADEDDYDYDASMSFPLVLPPWTGYISIFVRAALVDPDGKLEAILVDDTDTQISLEQLTLEAADLGVYGGLPPVGPEQWDGVDWYRIGSVSATTPAETGKSALSLAPINDFRTVWLKVQMTDGVVHDLLIRPLPSPAALEAAP
jgi:hypothetical protein